MRAFPGAPLMYLRIRIKAFMCSWQGEFKNWLTTLTAKQMFGRVIVR